MHAQGNVMVSLELLASLADSIGNLHQRQRARTVPSIPDHLDKVFSLVSFALKGSAGREIRIIITGIKCFPSSSLALCLSAWDCEPSDRSEYLVISEMLLNHI